MATAPKKTALSAIDRIKAENTKDDYFIAEGIKIEAPTYRQSQAFDSAENLNDKLRAWWGKEKFDKIQEILEELDVTLVPLVYADVLGHFFGPEMAAALLEYVEDEKRRAIDGVAAATNE